MLAVILQTLENLLRSRNQTLTVKDRIALFEEKVKRKTFSRKDYLLNYREIKEATASRDLKWAVEEGILHKFGDKRLTRYQYINDYSYF